MRLRMSKNLLLLVLFDISLFALCYYSAYWLRFDGRIDRSTHAILVETLLPLILCKLLCFYFMDLYRGMWRYTGVKDLINVIKASLGGSLLFVSYLAIGYHFKGISRGVLVADGILTIMAIGGLRLSIRVIYLRHLDIIGDLTFWRKPCEDTHKVLIVGTGPLGERLLRELYEIPNQRYRVIGFVDEKAIHKGMKIHGIPVVGALNDIPELVHQHNIDDILIADPGFKTHRVKNLIEACVGQVVRFRIIPSLTERIHGSISHYLRDIRIEDLLAREPVKLDMDMVIAHLTGKTVLITGAGGSIGSELARQIITYNPSTLVLFDNAETPLYLIDHELRQKPGSITVIPCIGDIRSEKSLDRIFRRYRPHIVYHAAAYKHVPLMEKNPLDAINTNILGTFRLASAACTNHVEKFIMISTDKVVQPTSIMGATKRVAEMIVQTMHGNGTRFAVVRFGNVLGSSGSVVPLFEQQIAAGGPVTVTHPEMMRFFMTIPEAVMLVLQAGTIGGNGELFLLDMGEPVRILDLAHNMIRLAGLVPDKDIHIEFIGLRPGEKLYEELLIAGEGVNDTAYDKIKICNNKKPINEQVLYECLERLNILVGNMGDTAAAIAILQALVPAYKRKTNTNPPPNLIGNREISPERVFGRSREEIEV